jgi:hypothetical protein
MERGLTNKGQELIEGRHPFLVRTCASATLNLGVRLADEVNHSR